MGFYFVTGLELDWVFFRFFVRSIIDLSVHFKTCITAIGGLFCLD